MRLIANLSLAIACFVSAGATAAAQQPLPFDKGWELQGDRTTIVTEGERQVLQLETGAAHRRDVQFTDGTIDLDVQVTDRRSFVYVYFRVGEDGDREEFYLRPHKSNLPDAVQYAPVWQGRSAWQLYHGAGATAAAGFTPGQWTHVRVAVRGLQAAIFVGDMTTPALVVPRLAREPRAGHIGLAAFLPANVPGSGPIAKFANVVLRPGSSFDFTSASGKPAPAVPSPANTVVVREWAVSPAFVPKEAGTIPTLPTGQAQAFTRLSTAPNGLLELHRYVKVDVQMRTTAAVARVAVRAVSAGVYAFDLGFSDIATVFVNGKPVFTGDASYSFDRPRREGLIGYDQARLYVPLTAGDNELSIVVSDSFGGWGLMGRFVDAAGLTVTASR
jgi:hypothetical protein